MINMKAYWNMELLIDLYMCQADQLQWVVPLRVYGDGADSHRNQAFEMFSLLPLLGPKSSTLDTRVLLGVRNTVYTMNSCRDAILDVISWSFSSLCH